MDAEYSSRYAELYRTHWWWRSREALVAREVAQLAPPAGWGRALDVGCGDALFLPRLSEYAHSVEGLEPDESLVSPDAARRYTIHVGMLDGEFRPSAPYDFVSMLDVLEHIAEPLPALRRCREIMTGGGALMITVPALRSLWTSHDDVNQHHVRYTRPGLTRLVEDAGFEPIESRYFFHWLAPPKWVAGATERALGVRFPHSGVPPSVVNTVLYSVSRTEQAVLRPFKWVPGSSLLLVARNPEVAPPPPVSSSPSGGTCGDR